MNAPGPEPGLSLEQAPRSTAGPGVWGLTALLAVASALALAALQWQDVAYFFSPTEPITLGSEGDYHFDRLQTNRYVQVHGVPTLRGTYALEHRSTFVFVGLRDTPLLVRRTALAGEEWTPGRTPPQPDQHPFAVRGRLLLQDDASRFREAFDKLSAWGEVRPGDGKLWLIVEGDKPRGDRGVVVILGLLAAFVAVNVFFLYRALKLTAAEA